MTSKIEAIMSLVPTAEIVERADGVEWVNPKTPTVTNAEINAEIARLDAVKAATAYQRKRADAYPDFRDYLDGVVKGDQAQIDAYVAACLAVKAKYPKG